MDKKSTTAARAELHRLIKSDFKFPWSVLVLTRDQPTKRDVDALLDYIDRLEENIIELAQIRDELYEFMTDNNLVPKGYGPAES